MVGLARRTCLGRKGAVEVDWKGGSPVGLHTILSSPILYGVWHERGGSVGGVYCAMVVQ